MAIMATTVGIAKLKNNLSYYIKKAKQGHKILVSDHGEIVVELIVYAPKSSQSNVEEKMKELVDQGVLEYDLSKRNQGFRDHKLVKVEGENTVSRWLIEQERNPRV